MSFLDDFLRQVGGSMGETVGNWSPTKADPSLYNPPDPREVWRELQTIQERNARQGRFLNPQGANPDEDYSFPPDKRIHPGVGPNRPYADWEPDSTVADWNGGSYDEEGAQDLHGQPAPPRYEPEIPKNMNANAPTASDMIHMTIKGGVSSIQDLIRGLTTMHAGAGSGWLEPTRTLTQNDPTDYLRQLEAQPRILGGNLNDKLRQIIAEREANPAYLDPHNATASGVSRDEGQYPPDRTGLEGDIRQRMIDEIQQSLDQAGGMAGNVLQATQAQASVPPLDQMLGPSTQGSVTHDLWMNSLGSLAQRAGLYHGGVTPAQAAGAGAAAGGLSLTDLLPFLAAA